MKELRSWVWKQHGVRHCPLQSGVPKVSCWSREHLMQHKNLTPRLRMDLTNRNICGMLQLPTLSYSELVMVLHWSSSNPETLGLPFSISQWALAIRDT
jgi:hypothetical protein